jgi:predicted nucleic-acid-binding protein
MRSQPKAGPQTVKITADTNLLIRVITEDNEQQSRVAQTALKKAELVAISIPALCELAWVLSQGYKVPSSLVAEAIRRLINGANVVINRPATEAGLAMLDAGGDFADGVIAYEGNWLGADTFVSFDKKAVKLIEAQGRSAQLLS